MGGLAIQKYAEQHRVPALILLAPAVPAEVGGEIIGLPAPVSLDFLFEPPPLEAAKHLFFQGLDDAEAARLYRNLGPESPRAVIEATEYTLHVDATRVNCPVLVFGAELDLLTPPAVVQSLAEHYGADYCFLPGKGHGLTVEPGWRHTAERMEQWLAERAV